MQLVKDLFSGEQFNPRRKNQKFISAKNRTTYHNNKAHHTKKLKSFIAEPLNRNHKILMDLLQRIGAKGAYSREFLLGKGYNLALLTHYDSFDNRNVPALFNFLLLDVSDNKSTITIYRKS